MAAWDPDLYGRYRSERERPAADLIARIPQDLAPSQVWDLGCGSGEQAALLAERYPYALVHGLDASAQMLAQARERSADVAWILGDIAGFDPPTAPDLIFTNAALHWLPGLRAVVGRLLRTLAPGGVFACQVPLSWDAGWYDALRQTVAEPAWVERLAHVEGTHRVPGAEVWFDWLNPLCASVDLWTTTYLHVLEGPDPIVDWMSGTGLRPYLAAFGDDEPARRAFTSDYARRLAPEFPRRPDGATLLPFPRLFVVART